MRNAFTLGIAALFSVGAACSNATEDPRFVLANPPDRASFPLVADMMVHRCGSLDCHGQTGRNLRLYGHEGARLSPSDRPTAAPTTTVAEYDEDFTSAVTLEPELMSAVVAAGGAAPERLTLVRKPRGTEHHKGGALLAVGDPADTCLTSWLANATNAGACTAALAFRP